MAESIETSLPRPLNIAIRTLARKFSGETVRGLADEANVSRPTVYAWEAAARAVLVESCADRSLKRDELDVLKKRLVLVMRCGGMSIRAIVEAMAAVRWGRGMSYGRVQAFLKEAGERADALLRKLPLKNVKSLALDEMFSQGKPVLTGMDLDSGFIVCAELSTSRSGEAWSSLLLERKKTQKLEPSVVLKDAGSGMASGVDKAFPGVEVRDDLFHAIYDMNNTRRFLSNKAYGAIEAEEKAENKVARLAKQTRGLRQDIRKREARRQTPTNERKLEGQREKLKSVTARLRAGRKVLERIKLQCQQAVERFDMFEKCMKDVAEAVEYVGLEDQQPSDPEAMKEQITNAAIQMQELNDKRATATGKFLVNRAHGLVQYMGPLNEDLATLADTYGPRPVYIAATIFRYITEIKRNRWPKDRKDDIKATLKLAAEFEQLTGERGKDIMADVQDVLRHHHRATSALEGTHSIIRPRLYRQKHVSQHALALITFYQNHRIRRWGRHKGTSAHQVLTAQAEPKDWISALGYPAPKAA